MTSIVAVNGKDSAPSAEAPGQDDGFRTDFETLLKVFAHDALRFLEYGAGLTTFCTSQFIQETRKAEAAFFLSLEEDTNFLNFVCQELERQPFEYFMIKDLHGAHERSCESQLKSASFPAVFADKFDFVCVDCRRFAGCIRYSADFVSVNGTVVLHGWTPERNLQATDLFRDVTQMGRFLILSRPRVARRRARSGRLQPALGKRAIIVPLQGPSAALQWRTARPWAQAYSKRVGAVLREIFVPQRIPPVFLKFYAARRAGAYDQFLLMDADVIIRPHAPDVFALVPATHLGVMPEGRVFPRQDWLQENVEFYGLAHPQRPYFNSGVLVLARQLLAKLFDASQEVLAFPKYEQNFLNWRSARAQIPLFELPIEFNYMAGPGLSADWRRSAFYHFAGPHERQYRNKRVWRMQGKFHQARVWQRSYPDPETYRYFDMRIVDQQMRGAAIFGANCDEMLYSRESGVAVLPDGQAYAFIRKGRGIGACSRLTDFSPGRYLLRIVTSAAALVRGQRRVVVEILFIAQQLSILPSLLLQFDAAGIAIGPAIVFDNPSDIIELRFHRRQEAHTFIMGIELERIS